MKKIIIGVMGEGESAQEHDKETAYRLGAGIARAGWVLLSGGRNAGVMDAVNRGAREQGGLTIGILPTKDTDMMSDAVDISIVTGMGSGRNVINVLSSDVVIACGRAGAGTASEIALALKSKKPVILLNAQQTAEAFFTEIDKKGCFLAKNVEEAIMLVKEILKGR